MGSLKSDEFVMICKNFNVTPFSSMETKGQLFSVILTGANEVPAVQTSATGSAVFMLSSDGKSMWYKVTVDNIMDPGFTHSLGNDWCKWTCCCTFISKRHLYS